MSVVWYAAAVAMAVLATMTVSGNAAVLLGLRRARRVPTHYPLASLAAADLLVGVFVLPIAAARELFVFQLNWVICSCWSTLDVLCCTASILSLCALGWERWCGITAPFSRAKRMQSAKVCAALVWPVSAGVAMPTALIPSPKHFLAGELTKACTVNTNVGYVFFSTTFSFYLPASVMLVLYAKILFALSSPPSIRAHRGRSPNLKNNELSVPSVESNNELKPPKPRELLSPKSRHLEVNKENKPQLDNGQLSSAQESRQRRATRTIIALMSLFLLCWTPFFVMLPIDSICGCVRDAGWLWCTWLGYGNSAINPIVYAARSPSVRRALHATFTSSSTRNTEVPPSPHVSRA